MIHFPAASTVSASGGMGQAEREPAQAMRPSRITTTASRMGGAPVPSTRLGPTSASAGGVALGVGNAVVTATCQPWAVRTNTRSLTPRTLAPLSTTR